MADDVVIPVASARLAARAAAGAAALLCASCASVSGAPAGPSAPDWRTGVTPELALAAIREFRADPGAADARVLLSAIVGFAERDETVHVTLEPRLFPACDDAFDGSSDAWSLLLGGFIAGNVEPQLVSGVRGDRAIEGVRMMLLAYEGARRADAVPRCEPLERWSTMGRNGLVAELVGELLAPDA